jgi:hypothetical protein
MTPLRRATSLRSWELVLALANLALQQTGLSRRLRRRSGARS